MLVSRYPYILALVDVCLLMCPWYVLCYMLLISVTFSFIAAAYPAAYGQFQQALAQHATLLPTGQKEGELKGKSSTPSLFISSMHLN